MRVKIYAKLNDLSKGPNDDSSSSNQSPSIQTAEAGKNLGDLRNLSKEVAKITVTRRFFQGLEAKRVGTSWIEGVALHSVIEAKHGGDFGLISGMQKSKAIREFRE